MSLSRRAALAATLAGPACFAAQARAESAGDLSKDEMADLLRRQEVAMSAFMRGDMATHVGLIPYAEDFTLMQPFGGPVVRGFVQSPEHLARLSRSFQDGEARLEIVQTFASGDLAAFVMIERQRGRVHGLPDQDWSLRVTLVYRRQDGIWRLAHRHADPLVRGISIAQAAGLARG